ncbi:hypothetical protein BSK59_13215 [Paenibacillus odorifer]|uniref:hypothetical protein n=1 Tax=Paenibacillus odorifer TaxID=189426 RepID=UPI00096CBCEC|nr:hypothetical protein [Paenibacillus odorifer]OME55432.1 hypothetical protein BSK59_13215 [Paenibacillus odorifer]
MKAEIMNEIRKAMSDHYIITNDGAVEAIEFVRRLLEIQIDDTEKNEPFATNWIHEAKIAVSKIADLVDYVEESENS